MDYGVTVPRNINYAVDALWETRSARSG